MQKANVSTTTKTTGKRQQAKTRTTRRKTKVYLTKDTKVIFTKPRSDEPPITTEKALTKALTAQNTAGKKANLTKGQTLKWMKNQGISKSNLAWGLQYEELQQMVTKFYTDGKDMDYILNFLTKQGLTDLTYKKVYNRILARLGVYAPVPNDGGPSKIRGMDWAHWIQLKTTKAGGLGDRRPIPGRLISHKVNLRLGRLTAALRLTEEMILFLYEDIIEDTRADWIIAHHYETYGRRNFGTILSKFYPMQLNLFQGA